MKKASLILVSCVLITLAGCSKTDTYTPLSTGIQYYYVSVSGTCAPDLSSDVSGAITINATPVATASGTTVPGVPLITGSLEPDGEIVPFMLFSLLRAPSLTNISAF